MFICSFTILYLIAISSITFSKVIKKYDVYNDLAHYKYIPMSKSIHDSINYMDKYILNANKDVYILDSDAVVYMIPIDRYHKDYDMFNKGNFGSRGEEGKIEDLKNEKNIFILIKKDGVARNWQTPEKVIDFVKNNFKKIGEILVFDIYIKE